MSAFASRFDLALLTAGQGTRLIGRINEERMGYSAAMLGDVNGDGLADLLVGGWLYRDDGPVSASGVYLMLGQPAGAGTLDLATDNPGVTRFGNWPDHPSLMFNILQVAALGDVNGDGYADAAIGSPAGNAGGVVNRGAIRIMLGGPGGLTEVGRLDGTAAGSRLGMNMAGIGDVNADGFADLGFIDWAYTAPGAPAATVSGFIMFGGANGWLGSARIAPLDDGTTPMAIAGAGDFNGDGFADVMIANDRADANGRADSGSVVLSMGRDPATGPSSPRLRIDGAAAGDNAGQSIASAGDFNGDGLSDLLIGAPGADSQGLTNNGSVYIVFGRTDGVTNIDLGNLGAGGLRIHGAFGYGIGDAVASAGDVNGDGFADILLGSARASEPGRYASGATWLVLGGPAPFTDIDLAMASARVMRFAGASDQSLNGLAVGGGGDADGDGFADILLSSPAAWNGGREYNGAAYLLFSNSTGGALQRGTTLADTLRGGTENDTLLGNGHNDKLFGRAGDDSLFGGSGHDTLDGGAGNDTMDGGTGNDTYVQHDIGDVILDSAGDDTLWLLVNATIAAGIETTRLAGAADDVTGTAQADQIVANASRASRIDGADGHDHLWAGPLAHTLIGGAGDDTLRGQDGAVRLEGGTGDDHLVVGHLGAVLVEQAGQGTDTAWVTVNGYTLPLHVEIARLAGTATQLTGSAGGEQIVANPVFGGNLNGALGDDVLWGSAGADTLNGDWGDDTIRGQGGADEMWGGQGHDHFVILQADVTAHEAEGQGWDTAWVAVDGWTAQPHIEQIMLSGSAGVVHANDQANLIGGNATRANAIIGAGGDDTIFGSAFADTLTGGAGHDVLYSQGGADHFVYAAPGWGYDQIAGFTPGAAKLDFRGSGISFGQLTLNSAGGNTQVEFGGSAILLHGVAAMGVGDFLF